jgi:hypothetical protein
MFRSNRSTLESLHPGVRMIGNPEVIQKRGSRKVSEPSPNYTNS